MSSLIQQYVQKYIQDAAIEREKRLEYYTLLHTAACEIAGFSIALDDIIFSDIGFVFAICRKECLRCGTVTQIERDRIIPGALGGTYNALNVQPLCRKCNASKGAQYADYRSTDIVEKIERFITVKHALVNEYIQYKNTEQWIF